MTDISHKLRQAQELLEQGRFAQARDALQRVIKHAPADKHANVLMRHALTRLGEARQALYYAERALATTPGDPELVTLVAMSLADCGEIDKAVAKLEPCVTAHPKHALARATLARLYGTSDRLGDCVRTCVPALEAGERDPRLMSIYASALMRIGRADEATPLMKHLLAEASGRGSGPDPMQISLLAGALLYDPTADAAEVFAAHHAFGRVLSQAAPAAEVKFSQTFDPDRKIRLGIISQDFRADPSYRYLAPVLERIDRDRFDVFLYSTAIREDGVTAEYKRLATQWREAARLSPRELAEKLREDRIDIALDMAGHAAGSRLLSLHLRCAPVQVTWWAYPCTTGLPAMDYRITDSLSDPPGEEKHSTERLVRIDPCASCYRPATDAPAVEPEPPSVRGGAASPRVTFVSFNALQKINSTVVNAWARVLKEVRGSRLVVRHPSLRQPDVRAHLASRLVAAGASPDMIAIEPPTDAAGVMRAYQDADVALDTFPYPGVTSACESLWMGVPVVTMRGDKHASHARSGLAIMHAAGLSDCIAGSEDEFVSIAAKLAGDVERRRGLRADLRKRLEASALRDEAGLTRKLESALRGMWRERCGK